MFNPLWLPKRLWRASPLYRLLSKRQVPLDEAEEILIERLAEGEITHTEFRRTMRQLERHRRRRR